MAQIIDAAGRKKADPNTGRAFSGGEGDAKQKQTFNDIIDAAKQTFEKVSQELPASQEQIRTNAIPQRTSRSRTSPSRSISSPGVTRPSSLDNGSKQDDSLDVSFGNGDSLNLGTLSGGFSPDVSDEQNDNAPDLNPAIESIRDWFNDRIAKTDNDNQISMPAVSGGYVPTVSQDLMASSDGIIDDIMSDPMRDYIGENETNERYIQDAIDNGMSEKEAGYLRDRYSNDNSGIGGWFKDLAFATSVPLAISSDQRDSRDQGGLMSGSFTLDDGSSYDYDHMTADNMTGTQYLHYAEMGMGGRPASEIDPTAVYSKRRENINYGFVPFVPDSLSYNNMVLDNALDVPARLGSLVGRAREEVANRVNPYGINIDGKDVNGPEFDRIGGAYLHQIERDEKYNPERFLSPHGDNDVPTVVEYPIPDVDGNTTYHYGHLTGAYTDLADDGSEVYGLEFSDGSDVQVSPDFFESIMTIDGRIDLSGIDRKIVNPETASGQLPDLSAMNDIDEILASDDPINNADVLWYPDLVMSDGTRLDYDEANSIYYDRDIENNPDDPYDDNITYDISRSILPTLDNRPSRLNGEIFGEDGIDLSSILNNVSDWTLGSLPISVGATTPWIYSASNASSSMSGIDPGTYDVASDSYGLAFGNYDDKGNLRYGVTMPDGSIDDSAAKETQFWNMLGNAAVPLTEQIVGPVGEYGIPVRKILKAELPEYPTIRQVLGDLLVGMAEEGVEEDLGNVFDELTGYGPRGMFANQATNENGSPMYDLTGHEVRDYSTPARQRMRNATDFNDLANSFAGGALVDLAMQMGPGSEFRHNMGNASARNVIRQNLGLNRYVEPRPIDAREVSESYLDQFDDEIPESLRR